MKKQEWRPLLLSIVSVLDVQIHLVPVLIYFYQLVHTIRDCCLTQMKQISFEQYHTYHTCRPKGNHNALNPNQFQNKVALLFFVKAMP